MCSGWKLWQGCVFAVCFLMCDMCVFLVLVKYREEYGVFLGRFFKKMFGKHVDFFWMFFF